MQAVRQAPQVPAVAPFTRALPRHCCSPSRWCPSIHSSSSTSSSSPGPWPCAPGHRQRRPDCSSRAAAAQGSATAPVQQSSELQALIDSIPFRKLALWAMVGLVAGQLQEFFGIVMGVFIVSFIGNSFITSTIDAPWLQWVSRGNRHGRRRFLVLSYFLSIIAFITLFGVLTIPDIAREGAEFVTRLKSDNVWVILVEKMRDGLGDQVMESLERFVAVASSNDITRVPVEHGGEWSAERSVALGRTVSSLLKGYTTTAATVITAMLKSVTKFTVQVGVALILGFFMLWDLPSISKGVAGLRGSRQGPVYDEVAPVLGVFGKLFGKALEAQARIALVNTFLTAVGMWALSIPGLGLLSLIVFVCSFIPIAGVIISTTPIGFVALTEYGFMKLALVILMVTAVHFVEAYMLNPAIYSAHLKLHPLMVLSTLVIAEHNMGVWGLLLAVPMTVFALEYLVRYPDDDAAAEGGDPQQQPLGAEGGDAQASPAAAAAVAGHQQQQGAPSSSAAAGGGGVGMLQQPSLGQPPPQLGGGAGWAGGPIKDAA